MQSMSLQVSFDRIAAAFEFDICQFLGIPELLAAAGHRYVVCDGHGKAIVALQKAYEYLILKKTGKEIIEEEIGDEV